MQISNNTKTKNDSGVFIQEKDQSKHAGKKIELQHDSGQG